MRARFGTGTLTIPIVAVSALAVLTALSFAISSGGTSPRIVGSSYSTDPRGARAAYLVLQQLGHNVDRSFEPIASLPSDSSALTLILVTPLTRPSAGERQALLRFVREGGIVLAFGVAAAEFLPGATADRQHGREQPLEIFQAALPGNLTRGARELSAHRQPKPSLDAAYLPVYGSADNPAIVMAAFGDGHVIWCLDESVIQNEGISRGTNVSAIANAVGPPGMRTILWDEYYHGLQRSFWSYVASTPLVYAGAQLGLVTLAVLVATARRRGPVRPKVVEPRTSPLEFIDTMASLYERAGNARAAVEATRDRLRRCLSIASGLPVSSKDDTLAAVAAPRLGLDAERVRTTLKAAADLLRRGAGNSAEAVRLVADLQELMPTAHRLQGKNASEKARHVRTSR